MAKQTTPQPVGHKAQAAARKPSNALVQTMQAIAGTSGPAVARAIANTPLPSATYTALPVATQPAQATPAAAQTPAATTPLPPVAVAVRGGLAIVAVRLTGHPYRTGASHNAAWWAQCTAAVAAGQGQSSVAALLAAGVPAPFVGYVVRRGYMAAA